MSLVKKIWVGLLFVLSCVVGVFLVKNEKLEVEVEKEKFKNADQPLQEAVAQDQQSVAQQENQIAQQQQTTAQDATPTQVVDYWNNKKDS